MLAVADRTNVRSQEVSRTRHRRRLFTPHAELSRLFALNADQIQHPQLKLVASRAIDSRMWQFESTGVVFTDDRAPVEQVIHQLILRYMLGG